MVGASLSTSKRDKFGGNTSCAHLNGYVTLSSGAPVPRSSRC